MDVNALDWIFAIVRNPGLNLQRNDNYDRWNEGDASPMCLCNKSGVCSNSYCVFTFDDDKEEEVYYQSVTNIAKSGDFELLYQELFSKNNENTLFLQGIEHIYLDILKEIAKEPHFQ